MIVLHVLIVSNKLTWPNRLIEHTVDAAKGHGGTVPEHTLFHHHRFSSEGQLGKEEGVFTSTSGPEYLANALNPNYVRESSLPART